MEPSASAILEFANKFGWLQGAWSVIRRSEQQGKGEPVSLWVDQIGRMKCAVAMWDRVQNQDCAGLKEFIEWRDDGVFLKSEGKTRVIANPIWCSSWLSLFSEGDTLLPAIFQINSMVNSQLRIGVRIELAFDLQEGEDNLQQVPADLLGCLWLQLAKTIGENLKHRQCPGCGLWFEVGGHGGRVDKLYCSDSCRMRVNRDALTRVLKGSKRKGRGR